MDTRAGMILLAVVLALGAAEACGQEPVKIGFMYVLSGRVASFGMVSKQGAELALREVNTAGGILGKPVEGIFMDTQGDPRIALEAARKLVLDDRVVAVMGVTTDRVAAELAPVMAELRTPLIVTTAMTPSVTGSKCNRYVFRLTWNSRMCLKTAALVAARLKAKRWTTVGPDDGLGQESWDWFREYLRTSDPDAQFVSDRGTLFGSTKTEDWAEHLRGMVDSGADGVLVSLWGGNLIDFVKQAKAGGFCDGKRQFVLTLVSTAELIGLGPDMPAGVWIVAPYLSEAVVSPVNRHFVDSYAAQYQSPPSYNAQFAYAGVKLYAQAVERAGVTDKEAVVNALEGMSADLPMGKVVIRKEDHQALFDCFGAKTADAFDFIGKRKRPVRELSHIMTFPGKEIVPPVNETGCSMK
ncbi:MAG: ABC transporter substrate-binding protein [Thermodesulfobacteriota bacterium]